MKVVQWDLFCQFHQGWGTLRNVEQYETEAPPVRLTLHLEGTIPANEFAFGQPRMPVAFDQWQVHYDRPCNRVQATIFAYGKTVREARRNLRKKVAATKLVELQNQVFGRSFLGR